MFNSHSRVKGNTQAKAKGLFALSLIVPEILLVLAWSSGFVGVRYSADYAPVLTVIFWRCAVVVVLLLPWGAREILRIQPAVLFTQAGIGLLAMFGYLACVAKGIEYGVPAGLAALMADLLPLGTALLSSLFLGQRLVAKTWCGLMLGVAGVLIVTSGALSWGKAPLWTYGLPLLGMISLALATLLQKTLKAASSVSLPGTLWLQCVVSLPFLAGFRR
ncbi:DMT family transporter [Pantoea sp. LMR881]|uniref:DMT family transporter n=1 Tax=Pantoea sp. LMR881 TaxID=3014336 RepID=UPI0022AE5F98|nr:DMT family transporter [Pantoea sp. LMR881]MCZ4061456.1 DMT family transporter [Pantoea sp. LMR881]